ncbi:hypothetical protein J6590_039504 [Homalodisca vitripennis]|nr:hypothetical protein J6590_039504 [Homalodisca vitripennis]
MWRYRLSSQSWGGRGGGGKVILEGKWKIERIAKTWRRRVSCFVYLVNNSPLCVAMQATGGARFTESRGLYRLKPASSNTADFREMFFAVLSEVRVDTHWVFTCTK